ncbi:MAG: hypothetical protein LBT47_02105 [Deltaproteobacteria bacterium]|jgi:hypothetical protein|nr:hypothetical protein [Deltaproteobacteria bacterium]
MSKFSSSLIALLLIALASPIIWTEALIADDVDYVADIEQYQSEPFLRFIPSIPQVMIVLERDWKIFYPAYNNISDLNGDGSIDNGFNPAIAYVGYFDVDSCYTNDGNNFVRQGPTQPQTQEQVDAMRPTGLKDNIPSPASAHGVCPGTTTDGIGAGALWAGNWLNYVVTSRMDAIRKVLYGGKRQTDTETQTILEPSYVPSNGLVWGAEVVSDQIWNTHAPASPWYPSDLYIGVPRPTGVNMHFFARVDHTTYSNHSTWDGKPMFKIALNVNSQWRHPISGNPIRYWDWVYGPAVVPDDNNMPKNVFNQFTAPTYITIPVLVEVCKSGSISPTEGCWSYGNSFKPVGLMQQYGERGNMQFGLITSSLTSSGCTNSDLGSYGDYRCNDKGGVLRHHIDRLPANAINSSTGQFVAGGIISTIDKFAITDFLDILYPYNGTLVGNIKENRFPNGINTGNAIGEMAGEAMRYLAGANAGYTTYALAGNERFGLPTATWDNRPANPMINCVKPFVLIISDIYPAFDGDNVLPDDTITRPRLPQLASSVVPAAWSVPSYLELVTTLEGYRSTGHQYYFPKTDHSLSVRGLCTAKAFDGSVSLSNISGFCPSEPSSAGSYSLVAAAYYGKTHDFSSDNRNMPVEFFVVGLSPSIPVISINDGQGHQANIVPTVVLAPGYGYTITYDPTFYYIPQTTLAPTRNMINFSMKKVQSDSNGVNFRIEFLTNFESNAEPNDIWERDHINNAEVALLTTSATPLRYRESLPYYINSGPFKATYDMKTTCLDNGFMPLTERNIPSHFACANIPNDQAYYAFRTPDDPNDLLDVTDWPIVGLVVVSNATGSDTGWSAGVGYSINGVAYSGVYIDTANVGRDNRKVSTSQAFPYPRTGTKTGVAQGLWYPNIVRDPLLTPWDCPYAGFTGANAANLCGSGTALANNTPANNLNNYPAILNGAFSYYTVPNKMAYIQVRSFEFDTNVTTQPLNLPNPLWLAAKYGGFKDANSNGVPDPGEWDSLKSGTPDNYFEVANLSELPEQLSKAFDRISKASEAVTATSDSITSVLGGGLAIQTSYVPEYYSPLDAGLPEENRVKIKWAGNFFSLFIDQWGNLREDTNPNGILDSISGEPTSTTGDLVVIFENQTDTDNSKITLWTDVEGINELEQGGPRDTVASLYELKSVWDFSNILSAIPSNSFESARVFDSTTVGRRLYTYTGPFPDSSEGYSSAVRLSNNLFEVSRAANLAPMLVQGYTLGPAARFVGTEACDETARLSCGDEQKVCKELFVSAVGRPPHGMTSIRVEIVSNLPAGQVVTNQLPGSILNIRVGRGSAKVIAAALNEFIYDSHVAHVVRAHINSGDDGSWVPNLGNQTLITSSNTADRLTTAKDLIRYTSGQDIRGWRSRSVCTPWNTNQKRTWRLGDIINSKPVIVAEPLAGYDLLYGDLSYSLYKKNLPNDSTNPGVRGRRIVSYFGSNDGILHAVNLGYYGSLADGTIGYAKTSFTGGTGKAHTLGTELWGFIPASVLPHLTWATDPSYVHSYYVDLEPVVVDIKNTSTQTQPLGDSRTWKPNEWRTILIGGLRLGGRTIELDNPDAPVKYLYSEYFALDVTDPEHEPVLLWRFSDPSLGLTITKPAVVSSVDGWHVLVASGPTTDIVKTYTNPEGQVVQAKAPVGNGGEKAYDGISNQHAQLYVLNAYTGALERVFGGTGSQGMPSGQTMPSNSFFNDSFVTASVGPGSNKLVNRGSDAGSVTWHNPTVYYGLTQSRDTNRIDRGALLRLKMVDGNGDPVGVNSWQLTTMYKTDRPVTGAVNATFDAVENLWVVFGTGRLWSNDDRSSMCSTLSNPTNITACEENHTHYIYGLKEPKNSSGNLTYAEVKEGGGKTIADVTKARVFADGTVTGYNGTTTTDYNTVISYMRGDNFLGYKRGLNIWSYTNATHTAKNYEMVLTQPKIDALPNGRSNMVFSTYEPSTNLCDPEGHSYLYLVDTYTGIPAPYMEGYDFDASSTPIKHTTPGVNPKTYDMISGFRNSGKGQSTEAWIIKSSTSTIYGNTSANQVQNRIILQSTADGFVTGTVWWREVLDMGLSLDYDDLTRGLPGAQ